MESDNLTEDEKQIKYKQYHKEYQRQYYESNKDKFKSYELCVICDRKYRYGNRYHHNNTNKHKRQQVIYDLNNKNDKNV